MSAFLILLSAVVSAATYYVDKDSIGGTCNNNNAGTSITAPWCTLTKASATVRAGDTVNIRAGTYTDNDNSAVILMRYSGTATNRITWQNYNNEIVILRGTPIGINFHTQQYITVDGITIDNVNRETSVMSPGLYFYTSQHCTFQNGAIRYMKTGVGSRAVFFRIGSSYNSVLNSTIEYGGTTESGSPPLGGGDEGDLVWMDGDHNLVQGCTIRFGGHDTLIIGGSYNIARNNEMYNTGWNRVMQTGDPNVTHRQLVEGNIIHDSGDYADWGAPNLGVQLQASNTIFRRNRLYNAFGHGIGIYAGWGVNTYYESDNLRIYHNVIYNCGTAHMSYYCYGISVTEDTNDLMQNLDVKNNIFYGNWLRDATYDIGRTEKNGNVLDPEDITNIGNHWDNDGDPRFTAPGSGDFTLQSSSPCINAGTWLTVTRSAGSGTSIPVNDASYFMDGWGIIEGDIIQLQGQTTTARITSINYDTNTITVDRSLTWTSGQGVALAYSGSAPDIGVYEYASGTPPPTCSGTCKTNTCSSYTSCTISSGTCSSGYCCTGTCTTTTPPACIEADWTYTDGTCQPNNTLVRAWTKINSNCQGGVSHPATETISCTYVPTSIPGDINNDEQVNIQDLNIVASDFGKSSGLNNAKSDTNNDGIVDIYDVVYVASRIA
ncbi:MAG TPA: hypothetical protein VJ461_06815 [Candidatus Nanoarchaeia archaeon]|nr:hypothetical protein [Candidatus Nanoarchaeia archaeon]